MLKIRVPGRRGWPVFTNIAVSVTPPKGVNCTVFHVFKWKTERSSQNYHDDGFDLLAAAEDIRHRVRPKRLTIQTLVATTRLELVNQAWKIEPFLSHLVGGALAPDVHDVDAIDPDHELPSSATKSE